MLLNNGELNGKRYLSKETCKVFTTTVAKNSRRGLGFDKPDVQNPLKSPCAPFAPVSVYGHTGFTGTCAWGDPDNGLEFEVAKAGYPRKNTRSDVSGGVEVKSSYLNKRSRSRCCNNSIGSFFETINLFC